MAFLYISEFQQMPITDNAVGNHWAQASSAIYIDQSPVAINGSISAQSSTFNVNTKFVRLAVNSSSACNIVFSAPGAATVTATSSNIYLPKSYVEYFGVQGGARVAVVGNAT